MTATASPRPLRVLSGGAAQGLVTQLQVRFKAGFGVDIDGTFGAVGMMKDSLLAGTPCDVVILSDALIAGLLAGGHLLPGSEKKLGVVKTGVAVKAGEKPVDVSTPAALAASLRQSRGIYFPDPVKATAGIHVMKMIKQLGLEAELGSRLRPFPNGAAAMKAMAESRETGLVGCTQITEILYADGVELVAALPKEFELATIYTAAISARSVQPEAARGLIDMLIARDAEAVRRGCGFEA
jgi:molybdate transport system substrate-binding protein